MKAARPQFAVVREDPRIERELLKRFPAQRALVVASGGCTALTLARCESVEVSAFDFNPIQIAHCRRKEQSRSLQELNVGSDDPTGLNQCGAFESLFRLLRSTLAEFVATSQELGRWFDTESEERIQALEGWKANPYWATAFEIAFCDPLLHTMFGTAATQHAKPGSYPGYFQGVLERGLEREDAPRNPFLQHLLLGMYRKGDEPAYVNAAGGSPVQWIEGDLAAVRDLNSYGLVSLSNIFDWSPDELVSEWAQLLASELRQGAVVVLRQLNNHRNLRSFFEPNFVFEDGLGAALLESDRSLFYNRIEVARRG